MAVQEVSLGMRWNTRMCPRKWSKVSLDMFLSDREFTLIYPERISGIATGCSRLISQGDFLYRHRQQVSRRKVCSRVWH